MRLQRRVWTRDSLAWGRTGHEEAGQGMGEQRRVWAGPDARLGRRPAVWLTAPVVKFLPGARNFYPEGARS
jgi:hypothetical protein